MPPARWLTGTLTPPLHTSAMEDTLVIDIETKNTFADVGGKERLLELFISVVGVYSYQRDKHHCFGEDEFDSLKNLLSTEHILVGFSSNKFDFPLLSHHFGLDLMSYPRVDISDEIEIRTGRMVGLGDLAHYNFETKKTHKGLDAPRLYAEGKIEELKRYCLQDVKITTMLYDKLKKEGELIIPPRKSEAFGEATILKIDLSENPALM
ncbi:MAG: ribonuclease H-like domain-containing protein [Candidatus Harrisonbacteria bacterium]|nr:ribonuclease H-like domain-containing protein [Candidatus Harrisonbacteria bacterium]